MPITTGIAIFFLIWWVMLFVVLPWGVRRQDEEDEIAPGTDPGAPAVPNLKWKLVWTTVVSLVVYAGCYVVYVDRLVTLGGLLAPFGLHMTTPGEPAGDKVQH